MISSYKNNLNSSSFHLFTIIAAVAGGFLIYILATINGPGVTNDSVTYLAASDSLLKFREMFLYDYKTPYSDWPPLFPVVLSFFQVVGLDEIKATIVLNAIIFAILIFIAGKMAAKVIFDKLLFYLFLLLIVFSPQLVLTHTYIWSEPLFILFCLFFLKSISAFAYKPTMKLCAVSAAWVALAIMQRYAGVVCVAVAGFMILFFTRSTIKSKIYYLLVFGMISCLPLLAWLVRNILVTDTVSGAGRTVKLLNPKYFIANTVVTMWQWFLPKWEVIDANFVFIAVMLVVIIIAYFLVKQVQANKQNYETKVLCAFACFSLIYVVFITTASMFQSSSSMDFRLASPVIIPCVFLIVWSTIKLLSGISVNQLGKAIKLGLFLFLIYNLDWNYQFYQLKKKEGILEYEKLSWKNSETMEYVKHLYSGSSLIYSNVPQALYYFYRQPFQHIYHLPTFHKDPRLINKDIEKITFDPDKKKYLVWFNHDIFAEEMYIQKVLSVNKFKKVKQLEDGDIYVLQE